jgi:hypothetical protein
VRFSVRGGQARNRDRFIERARGKYVALDIPDRPRNAALFADGEDILLYQRGRCDELKTAVERIVNDRQFARQVTLAATRKIRRFHTTERRTADILDWVESGRVPEYA